jgi:hypothetical protein
VVGGLDDLRAELTLRDLRLSLAVVGLAVLAACEGGQAVPSARAAERAPNDSVVRARPGYIIDSILPVEEEIRRFQAKVGAKPRGFSNAAPSREALVTRFVRALERGDTVAVRALVVTPQEFAYLIYPSSPNARPPYRQSPDLVWLTRSAGTDKAMTRLASRFAGKPLGYTALDCPAPVQQHGENAVWTRCSVRLSQSPGDTTRLRLFGGIVGRAGKYKLLSLTNAL